MKALTLWQPWASAMATGDKRIETRSWPAISGGHAYRGWLAITAAKKQDEGCTLAYVSKKLRLDLQAEPPAEYMHDIQMAVLEYRALPFGKIVAVGWLDRCFPTEKNSHLMVAENEAIWGDYTPGRYGWVFTEMWRINEPWAVIGGQKIFDLEMPANWQDQATKVF